MLEVWLQLLLCLQDARGKLTATMLTTHYISEIVVIGANVKPVAVIKPLGVILDCRLTLLLVLQLCARLVTTDLTTHTPSFNTRRRQHISMQHRGSTH